MSLCKQTVINATIIAIPVLVVLNLISSWVFNEYFMINFDVIFHKPFLLLLLFFLYRTVSQNLDKKDSLLHFCHRAMLLLLGIAYTLKVDFFSTAFGFSCVLIYPLLVTYVVIIVIEKIKVDQQKT